MLTEIALFYLNLCTEYRDIRRAKATTGVSDAWAKQNETTTVAKRPRPPPGDSDDDATASSAANNPTKKRVTNSRTVVPSRAQAPPSKQSSKASAIEEVRDEEPKDVQTSCRYGGLEDEDDTEEWEAIRRSPIKERGVRISDHVSCRHVRLLTRCLMILQAIVKVESPEKKKISMPGKKSEWSIKHLPLGSQINWRSTFVTSFGAYIGTKHNPWDIKDTESLSVMQDCWNHVYRSTPDSEHKIDGLHDVVVHLVGILAHVKYRLMEHIG